MHCEVNLIVDTGDRRSAGSRRLFISSWILNLGRQDCRSGAPAPANGSRLASTSLDQRNGNNNSLLAVRVTLLVLLDGNEEARLYLLHSKLRNILRVSLRSASGFFFLFRFSKLRFFFNFGIFFRQLFRFRLHFDILTLPYSFIS